MTITKLCQTAYAISHSKGFHDKPSSTDRKLLLAIGELIEAQNELRDGHSEGHVYHGEGGKPEGFLVEVADCIIRLCDMVEHMGYGSALDVLIEKKLAYNKTCSRMHGGKAF